MSLSKEKKLLFLSNNTTTDLPFHPSLYGGIPFSLHNFNQHIYFVFQVHIQPKTVLCPRGLSYPRAYQQARSSWGLTCTCPGSDAMGQAVCLSHVSPALVLSSQGGHPSEVGSIPTSFRKLPAVRTGQVFQKSVSSCYYNCTVFPVVRKHLGFSLLPCLAKWRVALGRKKEKHEASSYSSAYHRPWVRVELSPHCHPEHHTYFFKTVGAWLLAPFSSSQSPSHRADKIRCSHRVTIRPRAIDPAPRTCLLRPSFSSRFGSQVI